MEQAPCGQPMGKGCIEKSRELPGYLANTAKLVGARFIDAAGCEFNQVDGMHLTKKGHRQLAELLTKAARELVG